MTADFKCPECENIQEVTFSITEGPPKEVFCDKCKAKMIRIWEASIQIPEWFNDDTMTTLSQRMKHAPRPSGREKIIW